VLVQGYTPDKVADGARDPQLHRGAPPPRHAAHTLDEEEGVPRHPPDVSKLTDIYHKWCYCNEDLSNWTGHSFSFSQEQ
jgi:hypothetical protein